VLAAFFHVHPDPEPWIERLLGRWLWRGLVHGFTPSGQTPALRRAIRSVNPGGDTPTPSAFDAVRDLLGQVADAPADVPDLAEFRQADRWSRLALLALASLGPLGPEGQPVEPAAELDAHGFAAVGQLVPRHRSRLGNRAFWPEEAPDLTEVPDAVLRSQLVENRAQEALLRGDIDAFLAIRAAGVREATERFLAPRVDAGAPLRPPLASLLIDDEDDDEDLDDEDDERADDPQAWDRFIQGGQ
jgi:hypothetical protein